MAHVNPIQVQKFLKGMDYPCDKDKLVEHAKSNGADDNIVSTLSRLPGKSFNTPKDVSRAIGEME